MTAAVAAAVAAAAAAAAAEERDWAVEEAEWAVQMRKAGHWELERQLERDAIQRGSSSKKWIRNG